MSSNFSLVIILQTIPNNFSEERFQSLRFHNCMNRYFILQIPGWIFPNGIKFHPNYLVLEYFTVFINPYILMRGQKIAGSPNWDYTWTTIKFQRDHNGQPTYLWFSCLKQNKSTSATKFGPVQSKVQQSSISLYMGGHRPFKTADDWLDAAFIPVLVVFLIRRVEVGPTSCSLYSVMSMIVFNKH